MFREFKRTDLHDITKNPELLQNELMKIAHSEGRFRQIKKLKNKKTVLDCAMEYPESLKVILEKLSFEQSVDLLTKTDTNTVSALDRAAHHPGALEVIMSSLSRLKKREWNEYYRLESLEDEERDYLKDQLKYIDSNEYKMSSNERTRYYLSSSLLKSEQMLINTMKRGEVLSLFVTKPESLKVIIGAIAAEKRHMLLDNKLLQQLAKTPEALLSVMNLLTQEQRDGLIGKLSNQQHWELFNKIGNNPELLKDIPKPASSFQDYHDNKNGFKKRF